MAIDLEPIANFDAESATVDQKYLIQDDEGSFFVVNGDQEWHNPVAFALINPFVAPAASVEEPVGEPVEASEAEAA